MPDSALATRGIGVTRNAINAEIAIGAYGVAGLAAGFRGIVARNTKTSPTATQADDGTFMAFQGHTGSAYTVGKALITSELARITVAVLKVVISPLRQLQLTTTTRSERFRIGPSGQWGIGGATYGTANNIYKSGGASAAPSWGTVNILDSDSHGDTLTGTVVRGDCYRWQLNT